MYQFSNVKKKNHNSGTVILNNINVFFSNITGAKLKWETRMHTFTDLISTHGMYSTHLHSARDHFHCVTIKTNQYGI